MLNNFLEVIKRNFLIALLFLAPAIFVTGKINDSLFSFTKNSETLFFLITWLLLLIVVILFTLIFHLVEKKLNKVIKKIIIIGLIIFSFPVLLSSILFGELFTYGSCGKDFNNAYISAAKTNDPSFCFDSSIKVNSFTGFKGNIGCYTPNKDYMSVLSDRFWEFDCIKSFAKYTNNISHCDALYSFDYVTRDPDSMANKFSCIMDFAIYSLNADYCNLLPDRDDYLANKNSCIKIIANRTRDESLYKEISEAPQKEQEEVFFTQEELNNWKTLRDATHGYELKYPETDLYTIQKQEGGARVIFYLGDSYYEENIQLFAILNEEAPSEDYLLNNYYKKSTVDDKTIFKYYTYSECKKGDEEEFKYCYNTIVYIFDKEQDKYFYKLTYSESGLDFMGDENKKWIAIFNQIISTFKFVEKEIPFIPSIAVAVLSPNGGEVLKYGETYQIRWNCSDILASSYIARIYLLLSEQIPHGTIDGTPEAYNEIPGCPAEGGKFLWEVGMVERGTVSSNNKYQVRVDILAVTKDVEQLVTSDVSDDYFSIIK